METPPADPPTMLRSENQSEASGFPPIKRRKTDVREPSGSIDGSEHGADFERGAQLSESMDVPQALNFCNAMAELRSAVPLADRSTVATGLSDSKGQPKGDQPISTAAISECF